MKIAIIHEWLETNSGAERVTDQILRCFPEAAVYAVVDFLPVDQREFLMGKTVRTSFIQRLPFARTSFRNYLPLMPLAVEQFDLSAYDLIISCNHAVAKGVLTGPDQLHISYVHTPIRYAWDFQHQYLRQSGMEYGLKSWLARWFLHRIRIWDYRTAAGVDAFVGNSCYIARRIAKVYRREATVIYPPVDVHSFEFCADKDDYYLTASRLVPYKRLDLVVRAFNAMPDRHLVVIGDGPDFKKIKALAGPNVELLGYQPFGELRRYMQRARAFVFAAEEDFGIIPIEAQACGTPVIAFGKGGASETIIGLDNERPTGVFFGAQETDCLVKAVETFERERHRITPAACRKNAERFSPERFRNEFREFTAEQLKQHESNLKRN